MKELGQNGSHLIAVVLGMVVIIVIGFAGWRVLSRDNTGIDNSQNSTNSTNQTASSQKFVEWSFDGEEWKPTGDAPACEDPLVIGSPMDVAKATSVLYPGQIRGGDFKPHGGMGLDESSDNKATVQAIRDGYLYRISQYIESGEVQYVADFMDSCGIMFRYDHLAVLSEDLAKPFAKLPDPKADDSRTTKLDENPFFKKGAVLATEVGIKSNNNAFFDLGVYDLRKRNEASKTDVYKTDSLRIGDKEQSFFAVCWLDLLTGSDKTVAKSLPPRGAEGKTSDYCK